MDITSRFALLSQQCLHKSLISISLFQTSNTISAEFVTILSAGKFIHCQKRQQKNGAKLSQGQSPFQNYTFAPLECILSLYWYYIYQLVLNVPVCHIKGIGYFKGYHLSDSLRELYLFFCKIIFLFTFTAVIVRFRGGVRGGALDV